ncbi:hypothetical protein SAMN05421541_109314 [Actinoplanes philippinensis]|uniref:Uncharacterized protein n=1 Tax=Actinoplanes philippinensis TaxID=35752 RepID=A0A1I2I6T7_9ACTN|nr:hypothetical protein [Actinoplanes philippinensis]SFF37348.1 hypothetical protein SAMN05421541_109314 [Actinoplanes philippinensis]
MPDDSVAEPPSPLELSREPHDSARDDADAHDAAGAADHQSHDPYQPL